MKAIVTTTSRGVVTLPAKLRQALGLQADDQLIAETTPDGLLLRPAATLAVEVYTPERERGFDEAEAELAKVLAREARGRSKRAPTRVNKGPHAVQVLDALLGHLQVAPALAGTVDTSRTGWAAAERSACAGRSHPPGVRCARYRRPQALRQRE